MKVVRSRLMLGTCLPPGATVKTYGGSVATQGHSDIQARRCLGQCLVSSMSRSMALLKPGSVLMSVTHVAIKGHTDSSGLGHHLGPYWYPGATLSLGPCQSE